MTGLLTRDQAEKTRIMLGVLGAGEHQGPVSQRQLAMDLGIALGLANAYVKRCMKKGLLKVSQVPARRYSYYLTPEGFAEKARLTAEYLSVSFSFFRQARNDCALVFAEARQRGWTKMAIVGRSEVAEIAVLCAAEAQVELVALIDSGSDASHFVGKPVFKDFGELAGKIDGVVITAIIDYKAAHDAAVAAFGADRVLVPELLSPSVGRADHD